jgi:two-component system, chemotaxis family, sensor kinase CheA
MDAMAAIKETFFQECEEQLGELETGLLAMEQGNTNLETVNAIFRAVHSIKGGAGAFQLHRLVRFAHSFESTLDLMRSERLVATPAVMKTMLKAAYVLTDLVNAERVGDTVDEESTTTLTAELDAINKGAGLNADADGHSEEEEITDFQPVTFSLDMLDSADETPIGDEYKITFKPHLLLYRNGNEATFLLRELSNLGTMTVECDTKELPSLSELDPEGAYLVWIIKLGTTQNETAIRDIFEFVLGDCELDIELIVAPPPTSTMSPQQSESGRSTASNAKLVETDPATTSEKSISAIPSAEASDKTKQDAAGADAAVNATIRVDLDRVDRLINLVGELVINQAMLSQRVIEGGLARSSNVLAGLSALEQLTREIQESVMAIRAQPVKLLFQRMSRIVREVADATGKAVRLRTEGDTTEVDRTVIERLADPLTHMIRNAVDHGLEKVEKRLANGKSSQGEVRLSASHRSGRIVIEVADDGSGIDRSRVKSIAIDKGLIPADSVLSDSEIDNLLFLPGFSTAETVSAISGRGVGMDVVKRSIQSLGGRIAIASHPGKGTTFSLSLPLTLAVLDGMVVTVADQTLIIPLTAIVETMRPKTKDVHQLGVTSQVIADRGGFVPLIDVGRSLGFRAKHSDPLKSVALLVETDSSTRSALMVDAIIDQRQVVIKSLEANYRHVPGIAAATILGDGRVALILDIDSFVAHSNQQIPLYETSLAIAG